MQIASLRLLCRGCPPSWWVLLGSHGCAAGSRPQGSHSVLAALVAVLVVLQLVVEVGGVAMLQQANRQGRRAGRSGDANGDSSGRARLKAAPACWSCGHPARALAGQSRERCANYTHNERVPVVIQPVEHPEPAWHVNTTEIRWARPTILSAGSLHVVAAHHMRPANPWPVYTCQDAAL